MEQPPSAALIFKGNFNVEFERKKRVGEGNRVVFDLT